MKTDLILRLREKRKTMSELAKEIRDYNQTKKYPVKYIRNLNGYSKLRNNTTIEIVFRLRVWYQLNCIFMDGNKVIASCPNGFPLEPIYQNYSVILTPLTRE